MKKVIFKYDLRINDRTFLVLPRGSIPLHVDEQNGVIRLWVEQDKDPDPEEGIRARAFHVRPTGEPFECGLVDTYIGTVKVIQGAEIGHVYEVSFQ